MSDDIFFFFVLITFGTFIFMIGSCTGESCERGRWERKLIKEDIGEYYVDNDVLKFRIKK